MYVFWKDAVLEARGGEVHTKALLLLPVSTDHLRGLIITIMSCLLESSCTPVWILCVSIQVSIPSPTDATLWTIQVLINVLFKRLYGQHGGFSSKQAHGQEVVSCLAFAEVQ